MKVFLSACLLLLLKGIVYGQPLQQLQALVNAERSFAQTSKEKSTKEAFTTYMSDSGFIFQSGPVPGKKFWQAAKQGTGLLTWEPVFAAISSSGDMGYTAGPWEFRTKRNDADPAGTGYYVSVWKKEKDEWKVALDIGISHPVSLQKKEALHFSTKPTATTKMADDKIVKKELLDKEQEFINAQSKNNWAAYPAFITEDTRIYRPGSVPFITDEQRNQLFSKTDKKFSYQTIDAIVASSGDPGYAYGKAIIAITKDGNTKTLNGNYLQGKRIKI